MQVYPAGSRLSDVQGGAVWAVTVCREHGTRSRWPGVLLGISGFGSVCKGAPLPSVPLFLCFTKWLFSGHCPASKGSLRALRVRVWELLPRDMAQGLETRPQWGAGAQLSGPPASRQARSSKAGADS